MDDDNGGPRGWAILLYDDKAEPWKGGKEAKVFPREVSSSSPAVSSSSSAASSSSSSSHEERKEEEESEEKLSRKRKAESEKAQKVEKIRHKHKGKAKVTDEDDEETEAGIGEDNSEEEEETPTGRQPKRELKCHVCLKRTENTVGCQGKDGCDEMVAICVVCATVVTEVYCTKHASAE
jgi:hypothetical protein